MGVFLRLSLAFVALVVGNLLVPDGSLSGVAAATEQGDDLRPFVGTALIVLGAVVLARTIVTALKRRFLSDP